MTPKFCTHNFMAKQIMGQETDDESPVSGDLHHRRSSLLDGHHPTPVLHPHRTVLCATRGEKPWSARCKASRKHKELLQGTSAIWQEKHTRHYTWRLSWIENKLLIPEISKQKRNRRHSVCWLKCDCDAFSAPFRKMDENSMTC